MAEEAEAQIQTIQEIIHPGSMKGDQDDEDEPTPVR